MRRGAAFFHTLVFTLGLIALITAQQTYPPGTVGGGNASLTFPLLIPTIDDSDPTPSIGFQGSAALNDSGLFGTSFGRTGFTGNNGTYDTHVWADGNSIRMGSSRVGEPGDFFIFSPKTGPVAWGAMNPTQDIGYTLGGVFTKFRETWTGAVMGAFTEFIPDASADQFLGLPVSFGAGPFMAEVTWACSATNGLGNSQTVYGRKRVAYMNVAGTETCAISDVGADVTLTNSGTMTATVSCVTGLTNEVRLSITCDTSFASPTSPGQQVHFSVHGLDGVNDYQTFVLNPDGA